MQNLYNANIYYILECIRNKQHSIDTISPIPYYHIEVICMLDYSKYPASDRYYSGAERKKSILINNNAYIVKFQKNSRDGLRFNHISEFLGSHIFSLLGMETQET